MRIFRCAVCFWNKAERIVVRSIVYHSFLFFSSHNNAECGSVTHFTP